MTITLGHYYYGMKRLVHMTSTVSGIAQLAIGTGVVMSIPLEAVAPPPSTPGGKMTYFVSYPENSPHVERLHSFEIRRLAEVCLRASGHLTAAACMMSTEFIPLTTVLIYHES